MSSMTLAEKMRDEIVNAYNELSEDYERLLKMHSTIQRLSMEMLDDLGYLKQRIMKLEKFIEENGLGLDEDNEVIAFKKGVSA